MKNFFIAFNSQQICKVFVLHFETVIFIFSLSILVGIKTHAVQIFVCYKTWNKFGAMLSFSLKFTKTYPISQLSGNEIIINARNLSLWMRQNVLKDCKLCRNNSEPCFDSTRLQFYLYCCQIKNWFNKKLVGLFNSK